MSDTDWCLGFLAGLNMAHDLRQKDRKEFLADFEKVVSYFKLDGYLIGTTRRKYENKLKGTGGI